MGGKLLEDTRAPMGDTYLTIVVTPGNAEHNIAVNQRLIQGNPESKR